MSLRYRNAPPNAGALLEALRGLGYSLASALADIIDNSISANATKVDLSFHWEGERSCVLILDDGDGMSEVLLDRAMRLGVISPLDRRNPRDLGRFGIGLKTASFSQCRRLTVASMKDGRLNSLHWDLDVLESSDDGTWKLMEGPAAGSERFMDALTKLGKGTIVLWERLDRIVTQGFTDQDFLNLIDSVELHLAMVFHRYLSGSPGPVTISINGRPLKPWDPFLALNSATWRSPVERVAGRDGSVEVQCFVLPHKDHLSAREYAQGAGPNGWTAQQGFYVYRNKRLLLAGSWLGLGAGRAWTKEEGHRLARIRVDISNTADQAWKIDIRKSTARPPVDIRDRLMRLAEDARSRARRVFAHRGQPTAARGEPVQQVWISDHSSSGVRYRIDEQHPAVRMLVNDEGVLPPAVKAMLRVIEATVPVQRIWLDTAENKETPRSGFEAEPNAAVIEIASVLFDDLIGRKGLSLEDARSSMLRTEPFQKYPALVAKLGGSQ